MQGSLLKCGKCWQDEQFQIVWAAEIIARTSEHTSRDKVYLVLDVAQKTRGIKLVTEKPNNLNATGGMVTKIRKHVPGCVITEILRSPTDASLCIPLRTQPQLAPIYYLYLDNAKPPALDLVSAANESVMRFGQGGTYTKAKPFQGDMTAIQSWENIFATLLPTNTERPQQQTTNATDPATLATQDSPELAAQRELARRLVRKLKTLKKAYEKQLKHVPDASDAAHFSQLAQLLQQYLYRVKRGMTELALTSSETGGEAVIIPLDEDLDPGANLEALFVQSKRARQAQQSGNKQLTNITADIEALEADIARLRSDVIALPGLLAEVMRRHHLKPQTEGPSTPTGKAAPVAKPFKTFVASSGQYIFVGKSAADSDKLLKAAKANDFWFHCVGTTGSHVIVPFQKSFANGLPPALEREAAILALHHSNLKQSYGGEVYRSRRQFLKKRKGMPDGLWTIERSESFVVKYSEAEVQEIFSRQEP